MNEYNRRKSSLLQRFANLSMVWIFIVITSISSIISLFLFAFFPESVDYLALKPNNILAGKYLWTLLLHVFVHGSFLHLFVNMFVLFSLGSLTEKIIGRKRFLWMYLVAGIFAGVLSVFVTYYFGSGFFVKLFGSADDFMVGASGAIFAIAGLLMILLPRLKFSIIFLPFFAFPAYIMVPLILLLTWLISIIAGLNIGNVAHTGGFLIGAIYGYYLRRKYKRKLAVLERYFR
ncbi:hypothetical protein COU54_03445 [Candidatus Pacearchaeota archaeon CG10_big_fil_rev_8_21_14_0_10_31_24]|nr:MAG: hypothetical protein COU54_03445 [Candidatus Pacearchaeota archaeon CG10_big_fil_rev_8_21_14_0_10_31_24]